MRGGRRRPIGGKDIAPGGAPRRFLETPGPIGYTPAWTEAAQWVPGPELRARNLAAAPWARFPRSLGFFSDGLRERVLQPRKILVADDSKLMHKMYEVMLR